MPLVSIGLPVYNGSRYLRQAIESILSQNFEDLELVISDNSSTDNTGEICLSYARSDARVKYLRNDRNRGASDNFNLVYRLSRGKYFKWVAYDDVCLPGFLSRCVDELESNSEVVLAYPRTILIDENGIFLRKYSDNLDLREPHPHERLRHFVTKVNLANPVFGLIRSEALARTRLLGKYFGADYTLLIELALQGKFHEIGHDLFLRRDHPRNSRRLPKSELADWWDSANSGEYRHIQNRHVREQFKSILRSDLDFGEKALCIAQIPHWVIRKWKARGGAHKATLKARLLNHGAR